MQTEETGVEAADDPWGEPPETVADQPGEQPDTPQATAEVEGGADEVGTDLDGGEAPQIAPAITPEVPKAPKPFPLTTTEKMSRVNIGLVIIAILLAAVGMMGESWLVEEDSIDVQGTTISIEQNTGLDDYSATMCAGDDCETHSADIGEDYDNCTTDIADARKAYDDLGMNNSEIDEAVEEMETQCSLLGDVAGAGLVGMISISVGILALLGSAVVLVKNLSGVDLTPFPQQTPLVGSSITLIGIILWSVLLPEGNAELGLSAWLAISAIILSSIAGTSPLFLSWYLPGERAPGLGARVLGDADEGREFVLRETATGDSTLSVVEDGELFRMTRVSREDGELRCEDEFITKRDALLGFTHKRYDWLDRTRFLWYFFAVAGLGLSIWVVNEPSVLTFYFDWFVILFAVGTLASLIQIADPETIIFETSTGKHSILIYRAGSNRLLTNASMDMIDATMRQVLCGEQIDSSALQAKAEEIELEMAEARKAREEAARIAAEAAAVKTAAKEAAKEAARLEAQAQAEAQALAQAQLQAQAQAQIQAQPQVAPSPTPPTEQQGMPAESVATAVPVAPAAPIQQEVQVPADQGITPQQTMGEQTVLPSPPTPPPLEPASTEPTLPPPPTPPTALPPTPPIPPALPAAPLPPPPEGIPAPSPPAPPPMGLGVPTPLPPPPPPPSSGGMMMPPMPELVPALDAPLAEPAQAPVEAAPRVDTMSTTEKDELLDALN